MRQRSLGICFYAETFIFLPRESQTNTKLFIYRLFLRAVAYKLSATRVISQRLEDKLQELKIPFSRNCRSKWAYFLPKSMIWLWHVNRSRFRASISWFARVIDTILEKLISATTLHSDYLRDCQSVFFWILASAGTKYRAPRRNDCFKHDCRSSG